MDFNRAEPTYYRTIFLTPVPGSKTELFVLTTMHNSPYLHPRLNSILELCQTFPIAYIQVYLRHDFSMKTNTMNPA